MKGFRPYIVIAIGITMVATAARVDRLEGLVISLGLWFIVIGLMLWVDRTAA